MTGRTRVAVTLAVVAAGLTLAAPNASASAPVPRYDHVFMVVEENHGFTDVIGNPAAPNLNALAQQYVGLVPRFPMSPEWL